jgi:hypothetical protein
MSIISLIAVVAIAILVIALTYYYNMVKKEKKE